MKLTTKGGMVLKPCLILLFNAVGTCFSEKHCQETKYFGKLFRAPFATLKKSGFVKSVRGAQGGYLLVQSPDNITIGSILRSLEGSLAPVDCVLEKNPVKCDRFDSCITKLVWEKIRDSVNSVVDSITLADLAKMYKKKNGANI